MKIALVHDYIKEYGGAERVLEAFHEIWPEAPVYTSVYLPGFLGPHEARFRNWNIITSKAQSIPFIHKLISPLRLFTPWIFENFDFSPFDVVLVSQTGAYFPNLLVLDPKTVHISYCHTPPRYLYGYATARDWKKHLIPRIFGELSNHSLRQVDFIAAQRPNYFIANSLEVKRRIVKFYRREAEVIYPPVAVSVKGKGESGKENNYYLTGGRLARAKHIDLIIQACNEEKLPLKIFGKGFADYDRELRKIAGPTIEFVGEVTDPELKDLYGNAKALLYASEDEDFGIMPVEAMASGTPVIAYRSGGVQETIVEGKTGLFFDSLKKESVLAAVKSLSIKEIKRDECIKRASYFSKERFKREIEVFVTAKLKEYQERLLSKST